jgi:hypothetical protein
MRSNHARIATAILLATCPFATALADTKVILPHYQRFADTGRDFLLQTTIPGDFKTLEGVVWGLLTLSSQCRDKQFSSFFFPDALSSSSQGEGAQPLYMYFRGLRRDGRKVILRFTGDANRYLNNTAAIQDLVKGPLEETIKLHTNKSTTVYYEIDGQIVEEWDA